MRDAAEVLEDHYTPPSHLNVGQSWGPFPARLVLPLTYAGLFAGIPLGVSAYEATGLLGPAVAAWAVAPLAVVPFTLPVDPPAEHGLLAATAFVKRAYVPPAWPAGGRVAVYRMPTLTLGTASVAERRQARVQWASVLHSVQHPIKVIVRGRPVTTLPAIQHLQRDPRERARQLGAWLETHIATAGLIERDRLLVVPGADVAELQARTDALEQTLRRARLAAQRIDPSDLPLLRTLTWDPKAAAAREAPETLEEGTSELQADGWWTRAYALGQLPPAILTDWMAPFLSGDEPLDVAIDLAPRDAEDVKMWVLQPQINRLQTSVPTLKRQIALQQLRELFEALERRLVLPFDMGITVLVRGVSRQDVRERSHRVVQLGKQLGARLDLLTWEQAAGLQQLDPTHVHTRRGRLDLLQRRVRLTESGTVVRTYPWADAYLQLVGGVPWGEAGNRPCIFTPYCAGNRGPHMCWYGATNVGKGTGAHMLWSRLYFLQGIRLFGIDQDEQHEHCGRFLEYLGGRKLTPRDARDAQQIELHPDEGAVILDLSERTERESAAIFAAWVDVVKRHMLAHPGRSILFVDEATRLLPDAADRAPAREYAAAERALRQCFERSRHWGQSSNAMTQRPSTWFGTAVGRAVQGNADAWWCGGQMPRELDEVADGLELTDAERTFIRRAGIGEGLLVSGLRRVALDLFDKLSPEEYAAFHSDPDTGPPEVIPIWRKEATV